MNRDEEVALFRRLESGDAIAREEIVERNLRFVIKVALQFRGFGINLADLVQEGNVGLLHVVDKYDWRKGFRFSTYAAYYIRQEIQAAIQRSASLIRLPVRKARLLSKINDVCRRFAEREGRDPVAAEIAEVLRLEVEYVRCIMGLRHSFTSIDIERPEDGLRLGDALPADGPSPSARIEEKQTRAAVYNVLEFLTPREKSVMRLRYGLNADNRELSLRQASKVIGLSQEGVRRVEHRALDKLRRPAIKQRVEHLLTA